MIEKIFNDQSDILIDRNKKIKVNIDDVFIEFTIYDRQRELITLFKI